MKRLLISLTLIAALFWLSIPTTVAQRIAVNESTQVTQQELQVQLQAQFESEMTTYAATHTTQEIAAYAQQRIDQMTNDALAFDPTAATSTATLSSFGGIDPYFYGDPDAFGFDGEQSFQFCMRTRGKECESQYHAEVLTGAAIATGIFAACLTISAGTAFAVCVAAALAAHALNIAAAKEHYQACMTRAYSDCTLTYMRLWSEDWNSLHRDGVGTVHDNRNDIEGDWVEQAVSRFHGCYGCSLCRGHPAKKTDRRRQLKTHSEDFFSKGIGKCLSADAFCVSWPSRPRMFFTPHTTVQGKERDT